MSKGRESLVKSLIAAALSACSLASCASASDMDPVYFTKRVNGEGDVELTGWLQVRGEVMLFNSRAAMEAKSRYPNCISGVFASQSSHDLSSLEGKRVVLKGRLFKFKYLSEEDTPILPRKVMEGSVIPNFCFGENVVLIRSLKKDK